MTSTSLIHGFSLTASLIVAIGAQNAFVLKQGLKKHHLLFTASLCILFDCILIALGVCGLGVFIEKYPAFTLWFRIFGASFLLFYGIKAFSSALNPQSYTLELHFQPTTRLRTFALLVTFTFLNPHTYLDTIVLIGAAGAQYEVNEQILFILGAMCASTLWFFSLTFGAKKLSSHFQKPKTWQVLDFFVGVLMLFLAFSFVYPLL
ncbi:MAG TPA: LysE/ArgO family amino acid transporter [Gammaproteobacteria bacterium]|nr:LysE/ArgO family amino acid transporter [Gammaproteobacteria bacterium]